MSSLLALTLDVGDMLLAVPADAVREILDGVPITRVPGAPLLVGGLVNVRGRVVPLADLRVAFGLSLTPPDAETRIVVVEAAIAGEPTVVGLLATRVHEVTALPRAGMAEAPDLGTRWPSHIVAGIARHGGDFVILPDLTQILSPFVPDGGAPAST